LKHDNFQTDCLASLLRAGCCEFQRACEWIYVGNAVITNFDPVIAGEWTTAIAELSRHDGSLIVNDGIASKGLSLLLMLRIYVKP